MWFFSIKCKIIFFESTRAGITMVLRQLVSIINSCTWWLLKIRSQLKSIFIYCHPVNSNNCQATILPQTSQWAKQQYFHKENRKQHYTIYRSVWPIWLFHVYLVAKQRLCNMSFTKSSLTKLEPVTSYIGPLWDDSGDFYKSDNFTWRTWFYIYLLQCLFFGSYLLQCWLPYFQLIKIHLVYEWG